MNHCQGGRVDGTPSADARFRRIYEEYYDAMRDYCLRRLPSDDTNDALAEVFMVVWRRLDSVPDGNQARLWLFGVARKVISTIQRGTRRRVRLAAKVMAIGDGGSLAVDTESLVVRRSQDAALMKAIATLKPDDQELVRLKAWEEISHADIGEMLGISAHAVDMRLNRALRKIGKAMSAAPKTKMSSPRPVEEGGKR